MKKIRYIVIFIACICSCFLFACTEQGGNDDNHEHTIVIDDAREATCFLSGLTQGMHCSTCGEVITKQEQLPLKDHDFENATCAKAATCKVCGTTQGDPLEHDLVEYAGTPATCTRPGCKDYVKCKNCDYSTFEIIASPGHQYDEWEEISPATCLTNGEKRRDCTECDYYETAEIVTSGHEEVKHDGQAATCTEDGWEAYVTCKNCTYTTYKALSATDHKLGKWYVTTAATETTDGEEKRDCENCSYFETRVILATGGGLTTAELIQADLDALVLPKELSTNYNFSASGANGTQFTYSSSNATVLDEDGTVTQMLYDCDVTITVVASLNNVQKQKEVTIKVLKYELPAKKHQIILESADFPVSNTSTSFTKKDGYIELGPTKTTQYFYCGEGEEYVAPAPFTGLVVSWGAIDTSSTAKVKVEIQLRVNGTWSGYVSYGAWGFEGSNGNASATDSSGLIKISTDEIIVLNSKSADAIRYKVTLTRSSTSAISPKLKYLSFAFDYASTYSYPVNVNHLPEKVVHNVPKRYQLDVAGDGNVMCSATTTTMMLEYYGVDFSNCGYTYPQEYVARKVVKDNNMSGGGFGNWVYNTVAMSHYGFKSYVAKFYSIEELMYELTKGPVGLSIKKCTMTQYENIKQYSHSGHLIVGIGYQYINGKLYITCNDPYVPGVYCNYSVDLIKTYWKFVGYVIEK